MASTLGANATFTTTTPRHTLLEVWRDPAGRSWIYVQANGAVAQYDAVVVDEDGQAVTTTDTTTDGRDGQRMGVAIVAFADNDYGWVCFDGTGTDIKCNVLASCVANVPIYSTTTAGKLDDTAANERATGIVIVTTNGGSTAAVQCILTNARVGIDTAAS